MSKFEKESEIQLNNIKLESQNKKNFIYNFFKFLNIPIWLKSQKLKQPIIEEAKIKSPLEEKFDQFLNLKESELIIGMIANGYQMTEKQERFLNIYVNALFQDVKNYYEVEKYLKVGIQLKEEIINRFVKYAFAHGYDSYINENDISGLMNTGRNKPSDQRLLNGKKLENLTETIRNYMKKNNVALLYMNDLLEPMKMIPYEKNFTQEQKTILNTDKLIEFKNTLEGENGVRLLNIIHFDDYLILMQHVKVLSDYRNTSNYQAKHNTLEADKLYKVMKAKLKYYDNSIKILLEEVKQDYGSEYIGKITQLAIKNNAQKTNVKELPNMANDILENIQRLYKKIYEYDKEEGNVSHIENFDIHNLFEKRIPEILQKYLTIDETYRIILTNAEGKNAETLMIESLENIESNFMQKWEEINQLKVSSLSVTNKYTKNFKK